MKKFLLFGILIIICSCSGIKKTQKNLNTGNYAQVINKAISEIASGKDKKSNQKYIVLLEDAYAKNMDRELKNIQFLEKGNNKANLETIFNSYNTLKNIQNRIKALLPLTIYDQNRVAQFHFNDYNEDIIVYKNKLSLYLYNESMALIGPTSTKLDYRKAYNDLSYLQEINPGYKDSRQKMDEAYNKGLDYVLVDIKNRSDKIIPQNLEDELLNMSTYNLGSTWSKYHTNEVKSIDYDYLMQLSFDEIVISPEQVNDKQIIKEKQVKDGYTYLRDDRGNVVKDSAGTKIKVDKFKTVTCNFHQITQFKSVQVLGVVDITDLSNKQNIDRFPLSTEYVFEHVYANFDGDKRALAKQELSLIKLEQVPFPTNEQMVHNAGEDIKANLKRIMGKQSF